jgi:hypothetical protein
MSRRLVIAFWVAVTVFAFGTANATADTTDSQTWGGTSPTLCSTAIQAPFKYFNYAYSQAVISCSGDVYQINDVFSMYRNGVLVTSGATNVRASNYSQDIITKACGGGGHTWRSDVSVCAWSYTNGGRCWYLTALPVWLNTC